MSAFGCIVARPDAKEPGEVFTENGLARIFFTVWNLACEQILKHHMLDHAITECKIG